MHKLLSFFPFLQMKERLRESVMLLTEVCPYVVGAVSAAPSKETSGCDGGGEEEEDPSQDILRRATAAFCQLISLSLQEFDGYVHLAKRQVSLVLVVSV